MSTILPIPRLQAVLIAVVFGLAGLAANAPAAVAASLQADVTARPNFSGFWEPRSGANRPVAPPQFTARANELLNRKLTPGEAAWAEHGIGHDDANCIARSQPWMLIQSAPISIAHDGDIVILLYEKRSSPMHVYIGRQQPPPPGYKPGVNGYSTGRWEGNELVVESVGFLDKPGHGPVRDLPYLSSLKVTQRFRLENDGKELHARFKIEDPELLVAPYEYDFTWHRLPYESNYALIELCDARDPARLQY